MPTIRLFDYDATTALATFQDIYGLEFKRKLRRPGTFKLTVSSRRKNLDWFKKGRYIGFSDRSDMQINRMLRITQVELSAANGTASVSGTDYSGIFEKRIVMPAAGQTHWAYSSVPAETALKGVINGQAGPAATNIKRRVPNLVLESDLARGPNVTVQFRFQKLADAIEQICLFSGGGYDISYVGGSSDQHQLVYLPGVDRSSTVFFDYKFSTVSEQTWLLSDNDRITTAIVAGQGEGVDRTIVYRYPGGVEPEGLDRLEGLIDARDLNNSTALQERGDTVLASMSGGDTFSADLYQLGSFRYLRDFDLGDIVKVQNGVWGLSQAARIVGVTMKWGNKSDTPDISVEIDRPWPTVQSRLSQEAFGLSNVSAQGAVDYHAENHASRHYPGGGDPLSLASLGAVAKAGDTMTGTLNAPDVYWGPTLLRVSNINNFNNPLPSGWYLAVNGSTGAPTADAGNWYLHHIRHNDNSNNYAVQQAWHQNDANKAYMRFINNGTPLPWYKMWHSNNDGNGSGMDADTVRGYVPVNKAGDTMTGTLLVANQVGAYGSGWRGVDFYGTGAMDMRGDDPYFFWRSQSQNRTMQFLMSGGVIALRGLDYAVATDYGAPFRIHLQAGNYAIYTDANGYTGFGQVSPTYRVQTPNTAGNGGAVLANSHPTYSSGLDKENVEDIPDDSGAKVAALRPVTYNPKDDLSVRRIGLIAEEVAEILPEAVSWYEQWEGRIQKVDKNTGRPMVDELGDPVWEPDSGTLVRKPALDYQAIIPVLLSEVKHFRALWKQRDQDLSNAVQQIRDAFEAINQRMDNLTDAGIDLRDQVQALQAGTIGLKSDVEKSVTNLHTRTRVLETRSVPVIPNAPLPTFDVLFK